MSEEKKKMTDRTHKIKVDIVNDEGISIDEYDKENQFIRTVECGSLNQLFEYLKNSVPDWWIE